MALTCIPSFSIPVLPPYSHHLLFPSRLYVQFGADFHVRCCSLIRFLTRVSPSHCSVPLVLDGPCHLASIPCLRHSGRWLNQLHEHFQTQGSWTLLSRKTFITKSAFFSIRSVCNTCVFSPVPSALHVCRAALRSNLSSVFHLNVQLCHNFFAFDVFGSALYAFLLPLGLLLCDSPLRAARERHPGVRQRSKTRCSVRFQPLVRVKEPEKPKRSFQRFSRLYRRRVQRTVLQRILHCHTMLRGKLSSVEFKLLALGVRFSLDMELPLVLRKLTWLDMRCTLALVISDRSNECHLTRCAARIDTKVSSSHVHSRNTSQCLKIRHFHRTGAQRPTIQCPGEEVQSKRVAQLPRNLTQR